MWIFTTKGFVSIVADDDSDELLVRGRFKGDVEEIFPGVKVYETPRADYRFRAWVTREMACKRITEELSAIEYPNFKNACPKNRHAVMLEVWTAMMREQDRRTPPPWVKKAKKKKQRTRYDSLFGPLSALDNELPWPARGA